MRSVARITSSPFLRERDLPRRSSNPLHGRGNLVARLKKGSGKKKPLLIMGHIDVVGVEKEKWTVDPSAAWSATALSMGGARPTTRRTGTAGLEVLLLLHRLKVPLDRDVIFLAEAGEETSYQFGIDFMVEKHWDKIAAEFSLAEGGHVQQGGEDSQVVMPRPKNSPAT